MWMWTLVPGKKVNRLISRGLIVCNSKMRERGMIAFGQRFLILRVSLARLCQVQRSSAVSLTDTTTGDDDSILTSPFLM